MPGDDDIITVSTLAEDCVAELNGHVSSEFQELPPVDSPTDIPDGVFGNNFQGGSNK